MTALRDPQDERAAQFLSAGFSLTLEELAERGLPSNATLKEQAAAIGGLSVTASSFRANARKFCQRQAIRKRVTEIQYAGAALASTSIGSLIVEAEEARAGAMTKKEFGAANQCIQTKAKLAGLWRERVEATGKDGTPLPTAAIGPTIILTGRPEAA